MQNVERAICFDCKKIRFHKDCMTEETERFLQMGVDTILANDCEAAAPVILAAREKE